MVIHTVARGEELYQISKKYGVTPAKIIENNGLTHPDRLSVGKKLLILTPTKTYTVRGGDTVEKIARRFGVSGRELKRRNPYLSEKRITYPEQVIAIKYDTPPHSSAIFNGYYYRDTPNERLNMALAIADVITVSAYTVSDGKLKKVFNDSHVLSMIADAQRRGVMRIYAPERAEVLDKNKEKLAEDIINSAKKSGYVGICISAWNTLHDEGGRALIGYINEKAKAASLSTAIECDEAIPQLKSLADNFVLQYEKCVMNNIPSFDEGEKKIYESYARLCEPSRTFMDIPSLGYIGDEAASFEEIDALAYRYGKEILYDAEKMICYFDLLERAKERKRAVMESPENIKAKLELLSSLGFMGMSFDIMRIPTQYLMMSAQLFADTYSESGEI